MEYRPPDHRRSATSLQDRKLLVQQLAYEFFNNNRWKIKPISDQDEAIYIDTIEGRMPIVRREHNKATLALGIIFTVDGTMHNEAKHLRNRATAWCNQLQRLRLQKREVWYTLLER